MIPDSGAAIPVIGKAFIDKLGIPIETRPKVRIAGANNEAYKVEGSVKLHCTVPNSGEKVNIRFQVSSDLREDVFLPIEV